MLQILIGVDFRAGFNDFEIIYHHRLRERGIDSFEVKIFILGWVKFFDEVQDMRDPASC